MPILLFKLLKKTVFLILHPTHSRTTLQLELPAARPDDDQLIDESFQLLTEFHIITLLGIVSKKKKTPEVAILPTQSERIAHKLRKTKKIRSLRNN
jgi:hypothetical protein